jgi:hypothetical protein
LATKRLSHGNLYLTFPIIGNINLVADISGSLEGLLVVEFGPRPDFKGKFTLSLDKSTRMLVIDYDFDFKYIGSLADKLSLFPLPAHVFFLICL